MPKRYSAKEMYRTHLDDYSEKWADFFSFKREDGILEIRMHTNGGTASWGLELHRALIPAFQDVHFDPDNECVIFSGTGDRFLGSMDPEGWERNGFREKYDFTKGYDFWYADQVHEPLAMLNLEIPVIGAINGPCFIHQELALVHDIVIASESATMQDGHYALLGMVPGDGTQTVFRELLGVNRANYFLMTGQILEARQLLELGLVSEVVPDDQLLDRAWQIARDVFMTKSRAARRMTRALLVQPWREKLTRELPFGMAMEAWATHEYWPLADEPDYDMFTLQKKQSAAAGEGSER